jgi:NAD(P)-dependent dehydrogenase (short-subunit alcohol dehydrogenase family)
MPTKIDANPEPVSVLPNSRLRGKRALVTGGSDGIGLAIAEAFAREGAELYLVGRSSERLARAQKYLGGAEVKVIAADLSTDAGIDSVIRQLDELGKPFDVVVNNAAVAYFLPFDSVTIDQFQHSFALNVTATYFLTQRLLPRLTQPGGSVINISSYFADKMIPNRPSTLYSLSKGAINSLTKSLAYELGKRGIRVNAIAPGTVDTAMRRASIENLPAEAQAELQRFVDRSYPLGRIGQVSDIGGIAVYLASDEASWTSGGIFSIDGGLTAG